MPKPAWTVGSQRVPIGVECWVDKARDWEQEEWLERIFCATPDTWSSEGKKGCARLRLENLIWSSRVL